MLRKVICDKCGNGFKIKRIKTKKFKDRTEGNIFIQYFNCPSCKEKYVTTIQNDEDRNIRRNRRKLRASLSSVTDLGEIEAIEEKIRKLDLKLKSRSDHLRFFFADRV